MKAFLHTGYHATDPVSFAEAFHDALSLPAPEALAMRKRARALAVERFSTEGFEKGWAQGWESAIRSWVAGVIHRIESGLFNHGSCRDQLGYTTYTAIIPEYHTTLVRGCDARSLDRFEFVSFTHVRTRLPEISKPPPRWEMHTNNDSISLSPPSSIRKLRSESNHRMLLMLVVCIDCLDIGLSGPWCPLDQIPNREIFPNILVMRQYRPRLRSYPNYLNTLRLMPLRCRRGSVTESISAVTTLYRFLLISTHQQGMLVLYHNLMLLIPIRSLNQFPILTATREAIFSHRRMAAIGYPTQAELPLVVARRLNTVAKHIRFALMSNPPRFNIVVWNTNRPERPHRERPNTRAPNNFSHVMNFGHNRDSNPPSSSPSASPPSTSTSYSYSHSDSYWDSYTNPYQNSQPQMEISTPASPHLSPIEQLAPFSSCEISDALIKIGLTHNAKDAPIQRGGYIPDINMLSPSPTVGDGQNTRICGYAYTVKMVRGDDLHAPKPSQHFVDAAPSGSIAVISVPPSKCENIRGGTYLIFLTDVKSAAWGGLMTAGAQFRGVNGVIIDGRVRDLIEHRAAGFPVFARGHSTLGQSPFTRPSELNVPVTILPRSDFENAFENTFSAVEVHPGDIIVADIDGVVCIPRELLANVIDSCRYSKQVDEKCMIDIQQGRSRLKYYAVAPESREYGYPFMLSSSRTLFAARYTKKRLVGACHANKAIRNFSSQQIKFAPVTSTASINSAVTTKLQVPTSVSPRVAARNVLKSTIGLIPRTLPLEAQKLWEERAQNALNELETGRSRPEAFATSEMGRGGTKSSHSYQVNLVSQRTRRPPFNYRFRKNSFASWDGQVLGIKSNWLQNINGEIIECRGRNALDTLLSCDHIILVTDNLRRISAPGLQEAIYALAHAPSVSLVVTERASGVPTVPDEFNGLKPTMIKPNLAIGGLDAFSKGDVSQYQTLLMASGLPQFTQQISSMYAESNQPSSPSSTASRAAKSQKSVWMQHSPPYVGLLQSTRASHPLKHGSRVHSFVCPGTHYGGAQTKSRVYWEKPSLGAPLIPNFRSIQVALPLFASKCIAKL
ncbi:demethylmenaquinone methyltransferase domain-containing protein [Rhizoctonia solani AG-1 IA]|uniref:Demethylmenaquinone methyltransferase domain-containing protein n=1 Tax=Thanatephorus cucumeris (strain AG1-IA) TaxID=983506 RepID=L8WMF0_THACA|nr:demethylmenaquinone methyltransferase domain-containing protein [Rhizoctonia solani AG-1 IA]